ncbi:hypothetical protein [Streptomyces wuyuanensis]|uniref:hypothetical protein n=1 Tax=Streptomyces wuyuanensis TaxID=1196353 RepID=UPI003D729E24
MESIVGSCGRTDGPRITAAASLAFLDTTLRGRPGDVSTVLDAHGDRSVYVPRGGT